MICLIISPTIHIFFFLEFCLVFHLHLDIKISPATLAQFIQESNKFCFSEEFLAPSPRWGGKKVTERIWRNLLQNLFRTLGRASAENVPVPSFCWWPECKLPSPRGKAPGFSPFGKVTMPFSNRIKEARQL